MESLSLLLLLGILVLAAAFVAQPFRGTETPSRSEENARSRLLAEQERLLNALRELDFDYTLDKIPAEDYPLQRAELVRQGAEVMRRLDELPPVARRTRQVALASMTDDAIEERITARRSERREKVGGFCPHCGKAVLATDRFCSHCGKALQ